jgi:hypothetical protein
MHPTSRFPSRLDGREQQCDKHANYGNHDEQLDEGKGTFARLRVAHELILRGEVND